MYERNPEWAAVEQRLYGPDEVASGESHGIEAEPGDAGA